MTPADQRRSGIAAGFGAYTLWGLFPLYFHGLGAASAVEVIAHRIVWTFVLMIAVVSIRGAWGRLRALGADRRRLVRTWVAGALLSLNWFIYVWAVLHDAVIDASLGYFINPIVTVTLGIVVLGESLTRLQSVAVAFGGAAVLVLVAGYGSIPWISLGLAATFSLYTLLKKTVDLDTVSSLTSETAFVLPLALGILVWLAVDGTLALGHVGRSLDVRLLGLGLVTSAPLLLFGVAARRIPLVLIGLLQYVTPWAILLLGWLYYGEEMSTIRWAGFALIWAALTCLTADGFSRSRPSAPVGISPAAGGRPVPPRPWE